MGNRGGIIQGSNGFWHYDFVVNKKRYCGNTGNVDKKLARTWVEDFKALKRREDASVIVGLNHGQFNHATTCEFLLSEWLKHHHGKHAERLNCDWTNHILPRLKGMLAMEVTTPLVESIRTTFLASPSRRNLQGKVADQIRAKAIKARALGKAVRETPLARHTNVGANKLIRHLSFVFSWGVKTDRLPRMPFKRLKDLVEQEPVKTFLRLEQVKPFLAELDRLNNLHVMVAVRAMLYLGLREDEAMHMRWTGFDGPRKVYTATDTKTGENIPLPVPKDLRRLLETLRGVVDEGCPWCLPSCYDHRAKAWRVHFAQFTAKAIRRAGKKLGITGLRPHRMRGSMATLMARSGANAFVIKKAGRWKRMDTALRYVQVVEDDVTEAQRKAFDFDD